MLQVTYIGHSAVLLNDGKHTLAIDPFITGNHVATVKSSDVKPDFIFVTHAHGDHFGDTIELAKANNALVIAVHELAEYLSGQGIITHGMHIGGEYGFDFGKLKLTIAHHGSASPDGKYMGNPVGCIVKMGGKTIYHCGDTGLFMDMKLIGEMNKPDIMFVPIGGNYTMGIDDAVKAVEFVNPKIAIPVHYNTFPVINANPNEFVAKVKNNGNGAMLLGFGDTMKL